MIIQYRELQKSGRDINVAYALFVVHQFNFSFALALWLMKVFKPVVFVLALLFIYK